LLEGAYGQKTDQPDEEETGVHINILTGLSLLIFEERVGVEGI
jgi:hypothetical protein